MKKYFGTDGIRGTVGQNILEPHFITQLGWALGEFLSNTDTVVIGKDTRLSGDLIESALIAGLNFAGNNVICTDVLPTPAVAYLTRQQQAALGVIITASHNQFQDNGIKLCNHQGFKLNLEQELSIENLIAKPMQAAAPKNFGHKITLHNALEAYAKYCCATIQQKDALAGMNIVLDCANGATFKVAPEIFSSLGAKVIVLNANPNGTNINYECGSTYPALLQREVLTHNADLGIAFDGDGDRVILVDEKGEIKDGDDIIYILAQFLLSQNMLQGGVVGTIMSNMGLELALKKLHIPFLRTQVGDSFVASELMRNNWLLGGETSGHIINLQYTTMGDGIITALQVINAMKYANSSLHELCQGLQKSTQKMINIKLHDALPPDILEHNTVKKAIAEKEKMLHTQGRIIVRKSGTEPVLRVMVEGQDPNLITNILKTLANELEDLCSKISQNR